MVDIKHPLHKLLTQEMIDELQIKYEERQKEKRDANFQAKADALLEAERIEASGHARIIITENPRLPELEISEEPEEKPIIKKVVEKVKEIIKPKEELVEDPITSEEIEIEQTEVIQEMKEAINHDHKEIVNENKVKCPECLEWYTKGGAFAKHYKSHFPE